MVEDTEIPRLEMISDVQENELKKNFTKADFKNTGFLDFEEVKKLMEGLNFNDKEAKQAMDIYDVKNNKRIDFDEFRELYLFVKQFKKLQIQMEDLFEKYAISEEGLDEECFVKVASDILPEKMFEEEDMKQMFAQFDRNDEKRINRVEFFFFAKTHIRSLERLKSMDSYEESDAKPGCFCF